MKTTATTDNDELVKELDKTIGLLEVKLKMIYFKKAMEKMFNWRVDDWNQI